MEKLWYYVENKERKGPLKEFELKNLIVDGIIQDDTYLWSKGLEGWKRLNEIEELMPEEDVDIDEEVIDVDEVVEEEQELDWDKVEENKKIFTIKTGLDRGGKEVEYGPFSLLMLRKLYDEKRINLKTLLYTTGLTNWMFLADMPIFERIFDEVPLEIEEKDRRINVRKPFVAKILFHDADSLYEGVCRDVSVGGLQVLVADFPAKVGSNISLNVHPDNSSLCFTAEAEVVRKLGGNSGFSVRFLDLDEETKVAIGSYVKSS